LVFIFSFFFVYFGRAGQNQLLKIKSSKRNTPDLVFFFYFNFCFSSVGFFKERERERDNEERKKRNADSNVSL
jgi:hypothetical protein